VLSDCINSGKLIEFFLKSRPEESKELTESEKAAKAFDVIK